MTKSVQVVLKKRYRNCNVGEVVGVTPLEAEELIEKKAAVYADPHSKREKLTDEELLESKQVDWMQVVRVTKELSGVSPRTKTQVRKLLNLDGK